MIEKSRLRGKAYIEPYTWGNNCKGWHLVEHPELGVIQEMMPPGTEERLHYHKIANQFFFILKGKAIFEIEEETMEVQEGEGILIRKGQKHKIKNTTTDNLEFIVTSQPHSHQDRINIE